MRALINDRRVYIILMGAIVLIFSVLTIQRNQIYKDEVSLWTDTIKQSPYKSRPYTNLGAAYCRRGEYLKGEGYLQRALELEPGNFTALANLAESYTQTKVFDKAVAIDERVLQMAPWSPLAYNNLGVIYYMKGDLSKAQWYFDKALLRSNYSYQEAYFNLAKVYLRKGDIEGAKKIYLMVISQSPRENMAKYALIQIYLAFKQIPQMEAMAKDILASQDNDPQELVNIGSVFVAKGYLDLALDFFTKAVSIDYTYSGAYIEMGKLFYDQHKLDDAIHIWQMGLKYTSDTRILTGLIIQAQKH